MRRRAATLVGCALVVALALPAAAQSDDPPVPAPAEEADPASELVSASEAPPDEVVHLTLSLARDQEGLAGYVRDRAPGASPLTTDELSRRFGASDATRAAVVGYFATEGLEARVDATGLFATVTTDVATAERLFGTDVVVPGDAPEALTTTAPAQVPDALVGHVDAVLGLDTTATADAASAFALGPSGPSPVNTGTPEGCPEAIASGASTPNQQRRAYGIDALAAYDGPGVRVAVVDFQGFLLSDYETANQCFGRDTVAPVTQLVDPVTAPLPPALETTLDLQVVAGIVPHLGRLDVFEGGGTLVSFPALYAAPLDPARYPDGVLPDVISSSLGQCEPAWTEEIVELMESVLAAAAAVGVTVVSAAGDHGSSGCWQPGTPVTAQEVWYPASSHWVTAIGGTNVTFAPDNTIVSETVWNDGVFSPSLAADGGGGGPSRVFARPAFQQGIGVGGDARIVPDLAFLADPYPGYALFCSPGVCAASGGWAQGGGTSAATPLFASALALIVERREMLGLGRLGWINPTIYELARTRPDLFRDVVQGTNDLFGVGCCTATVGYDPASGWGSLAIDRLAEVLAPIPVPEPTFTG